MKLLSTLFLLVRRSLAQHRLSTAVTVFSAALGSGLVMAVFNVSKQAERAFSAGDLEVDAVLGARGSELQLVLNSIFHLETSPGNIPWALYEEIRTTRGVTMALPYAVGDNYQGFRVVGTEPAIFSELTFGDGRTLEVWPAEPPGGEQRPWPMDASRREAVIGATVAERTGLTVGSTFQPTHGVVAGGGTVHEETYVVTAIVEPTSTPLDRVVFIPIEGIFRMGGHYLRGAGEEFQAEAGEAIPDEHKEVSAVLLQFSNPTVGFNLDRMMQSRSELATLAYPVAQVMGDIFDKLGWVNRVLEVVAYLVVLVAAASILAAIYNTMNERRREFAILRALGARRATVFSAIVLEAGTIAALGALVGFLVYGGILLLASTVVRNQTGVHLDLATFHPMLVGAPLGMVLLGVLSGVLPALVAYSTDVADNLLPTS
ncbi:MAG: ABC transporter permease [Planctomycetota bacterium]